MLHPARAPQVSALGGAVHRALPSARFTLSSPPASPGFFSNAFESDTNAEAPSVAKPHSMPPRTPPSPARIFHTISPLSAFTAYSSPDFCPAITSRRPSSVTRAVALPKS